MKNKKKVFSYFENKIIFAKNLTETNTIFYSEMESKRNDNKNTYSTIRKNLLSIVKEDLKNSNELVIKSYKEDIDFEKLKTTHSLNFINTEIDNDGIYEINSEEELDLEYAKNKYAGNDCSSSNMSD